MRWLVLLVILLCAPATLAGGSITFTPAVDDEVVVHNPDMGWVLYENYPVDPRPVGSSTLVNLPDERFDGVDHVALMFTWADVERADGEYDFAPVDRAYDHWRSRGKQIQLRMSSESLLWWSKADPATGLGVPAYVLDRLPATKKQRRESSGFEYNVVDAREPYYLDRLAKFLAAVAKHFGNDRPVTLIDLRGFGLWGEWHTGYRYASDAERREALTKAIDVWSAAFPKHHLAISYSYDPDGPKDLYAGPTDRFDPASTSRYEDFLRYSAFDHAMTKSNVTLRRDGVGGAVHSNERKLCDETFATLAKGPFSCEFLGGYSDNKRGGEKWLTFMLNDALSLHPNYINLLGYQAGDALAFIKEQPELFKRGSREMGYRLVPTRVTFKSSKLEITWQNRGVGRAMRDFELRLIVGDKAIDLGPIPTSRWVKGNDYVVAKALPAKLTGDLHIALIDRTSGKPIALPLRDRREADNSYLLGTTSSSPSPSTAD